MARFQLDRNFEGTQVNPLNHLFFHNDGGAMIRIEYMDDAKIRKLGSKHWDI